MVKIRSQTRKAEIMGSCEICGSSNVSTKRASSNGRDVLACDRCMKATGLKPNLTGISQPSNPGNVRGFGGYGGMGRTGKDIMVREEKELAPDFGARVIDARRKKGIEQRELAREISERLNVIQRVEKGQHPGDSVIKKLERYLDIELMIERTPDEQQQVGTGTSRPMTLGDYIQDALRKE